MSDLISRSALIKELCENTKIGFYGEFTDGSEVAYTQREIISFNEDGFIGFAGWADQGNTNPILRAFLKWCDYLADSEV